MSEKCIRVLLVEDNPGDARLIELLLGESRAPRFAVEHVDRLAAALTRVKLGDIDVALLDLSLPDSGSRDTFVTFCAQAPSMPIIVLTGNDDDTLATKALQEGAQDYLIKGQNDPRVISHAISYAIERKRVQILERERTSMEETTHATKQAIGVIAHDLRTPLAAMRAMAEYMITDGVEGTPDFRKMLQGIHDEVIRLSEMVNDVLEMARQDSGKARWQWSTFELGSVCQEAISVIRQLIDTSKIELTCDIQPRELTMMGDSMSIRRLLLNLLSNAQKHTKSGRIGLRIRREQDTEGLWVNISVEDTGRGISREVADQLGSAFALNSGVIGSTAKGAGLGLTICKGISAAHGGAISVVSTVGQGSIFTARVRADLSEASARPGELKVARLAA